MRLSFSSFAVASTILLFCVPFYVDAQTTRSAPYDFTQGCNSSSKLLNGGSFVDSNYSTGELDVGVQAAGIGKGFGRAGAGIVYNPNFTGTARIRTSVRVEPPSQDFIWLLGLDIKNVNLLGKVSLTSHAFVSVTGDSTNDVLATNQFRNSVFGTFELTELFSNPFDFTSPLEYETRSYNPAEVVAITTTVNVIQGQPLRICGGIQSYANASSFVPYLGTLVEARYHAQLLQISVIPLTYSPTPTSTPTPRPTPVTTPIQTPTHVRPSIFVIKKNDTGIGATEAHILSGPDMFRRFAINTSTAQHATGEEHVFRVADWDRDGQPDIFAIKKHMSGTDSTEVHILSGAGSYQRFLLNTGTPQHETWDEYDFQVADWNRDGFQDLIVIKKYNTGTNSTEVHILSGARNFQDFILHTGTPQEETGGGNYDFDIGDRNRDGYPDLFIIKKYGTGTGMVEVHVLSGASDFQHFILNTGTAQHPTGDEYTFRVADWDGDGIDDLFGIKKNQTGTGSTEIHILSGVSNFQQFLLHTSTVQSETGDNYDFEVARVKTYDTPSPIGNPIGREAQQPSFNAAAGLISSSLSANRSAPIAIAVANSGGAVSGAITDVEIIDAGGRKVWQQVVENQTFAAGESKAYTFTWTPTASGTYQIKIGIFATNWSPLLYWNDNAATVSVSGEPTPSPTPAPIPNSTPSTSNELQVWWPNDGAQMSGTQPFKAMLTNLPVENYRAYWQVDGGSLNELSNNYSDYPHKESIVDLTGWTWRGTGPYQLRFVATDFSGRVLAESTMRIYVVN